MPKMSRLEPRALDSTGTTSANTDSEAQPLPRALTSHAISVTDKGDLVLIIRHQSSGEEGLYRVDTRRIRDASSYFDKLLHPEKFSEGLAVFMAQQKLRSYYAESSLVPWDKLPRIGISDAGQTSKANLFEKYLKDFLRILHGLDISTSRPSTSYFANIAIIADRLEALPVVVAYIKKSNCLQKLDGQPNKIRRAFSQERLRQRLLVGSLLDYPDWIESASERLILGSQQIKDPQGDISHDVDDVMWWDLPGCLEARQCKLGYDSSAQCDSFQLGEMVRFFTRMGTIRMQGLIYDASEAAEPYDGDIQQLLENLRQCPSYQIDQNHAHCGLRVRLLPALTCIQRWIELDAKLCGISWQNDRGTYAWTNHEKVAKWSFLKVPDSTRKRVLTRSCDNSCNSVHQGSRELFTAKERDWTPSDR
ncbi:MAG: hypothetical protein M1836_001865 [Candelina mexicana]|nr:MAG: hypothetical protein M1836_001865 [Candelina mexicana]